ncbi:hypothetical protein JOF56_000832 [Kibdelosporangium banguiense]|uniref:DUF3558 domain-containing protein n=1 Tax=Kibdelosporangium banguiense TaxID=1365924 RepID=A0ABS4T7Q1_9PSEU|nr:DUF3558 family protein [Kibdelosporangium banguiense]MBP2320447.1 hypothetical protein [Kibdelosporangium banguiense]
MKLRNVSALAAAIGLLAACSPSPAPSPPTATTSANTTTTSSVPAPLAPFAAAPCTLLTDAQRTALGNNGFVVRPGKVKTSAQVPACEFGDLNHRETGTLWVTAFVVTDSGLAKLATDHTQGFSPEYWKPDTLAGHPVIYYTRQSSPEFCDVAIGITDTTYVGVDVIQFNLMAPREQGSCKAATAVAEQMLATITGGK